MWAWPRWPTSGTSSTRALRHVTEGIALCRQFVYTPPLAAGLVTLAWIRQATGDPAGALEAIGEAGQAAPGPRAGLLNPVPAQRARLLLAQGDLAAAARWTQETRPRRRTTSRATRRSRSIWCWPGCCSPRTGPAAALALLDRLHAAAAAQDRTGSVIETGALRALALAASGEEAAAVDALAEALTLACPQGYVRVFADEGAADGRAAGPADRGPAGRPGPAAASRSAAWPGCSARSTPGTRRPGRPGSAAAGAGPGRAADQPRAGGAGDAGGGPVEPGHRRASSWSPSTP